MCTKMAYIFSKRFTPRLFSTSLFLFFGMHYTWLCYHYAVTNPKKSIFDLHSNITSSRNWLRLQAHGQLELEVDAASPRCETSVFLVVVVFSAPNNFEERSVIRSTWSKIKDSDANITRIIDTGLYTVRNLVRTVFLLGKTVKSTQSLIETESKYYKDIVTGSFTDSYGNLTLKTKLGLEWAHQFCNFEYYLKTDDDVFVYTKGLVKWLWQLPREKVYTGRCSFNSTVIRTVGHKWSVSRTVYGKKFYPPYCVGMGYVLSSDVLQNMTMIIPKQRLFVFEDVYVGFILEKLNILPVDNREYFQVNLEYSWDVCQNRDMLLSLPANPNEILQLYLKFSTVSKCDL